MEWYFSIVVQYKAASNKYLAGDSNTVFPPGTINPDISSNFVARGTRCGRLRGLMHFFRAKTY